jgi:Leucine-rich repeat (LRR) protein
MSGSTLSALDCFNVFWVWHVLQQNQDARGRTGIQQVVHRNLHCLANTAEGMGSKEWVMRHELCLHSPNVNKSSFVLRFPQNLMPQLFSFLTTQEMRSLSEVDKGMLGLPNREKVVALALKQQIVSRNSFEHPMTYQEYLACKSSGVLPSGDQIHHICLQGPEITDAVLVEILEKYPNIQSLTIHGAANLTDLGVHALEGCTKLTHLELVPNWRITDVGFAALKKLSKLTDLILGEMNFTDTALQSLEGLSELRNLKIRHAQITDAGLSSLSNKLPRLRRLNLNGCRAITDVGLVSLRNLSLLEVLILSDTKITDAGLPVLASLSSLRNLNLQGCNISDEGVSFLGELSQLTGLNLSRCNQISNASLASLGKLSRLTYLNLSWCDQVTIDGVWPLLRTLPQLEELTCDHLPLYFRKGTKAYQVKKAEERGLTLPQFLAQFYVRR